LVSRRCPICKCATRLNPTKTPTDRWNPPFYSDNLSPQLPRQTFAIDTKIAAQKVKSIKVTTTAQTKLLCKWNNTGSVEKAIGLGYISHIGGPWAATGGGWGGDCSCRKMSTGFAYGNWIMAASVSQFGQRMSTVHSFRWLALNDAQ